MTSHDDAAGVKREVKCWGCECGVRRVGDEHEEDHPQVPGLIYFYPCLDPNRALPIAGDGAEEGKAAPPERDAGRGGC